MDEVKVNSHGTNAKFKFNIFDDKQMKEIGFTNFYEPYWFYCKPLLNDIEFSVTIPKDGSEAWIDVLDSNFCQPYDYQKFLENTPDHKFAKRIKGLVDEEMVKLTRLGVIENYEVGDYV